MRPCFSMLLSALVGLACLSADEGEPEQAMEVLSVVLHHYATPQIDRQKAQLLLSGLACELPPEVFAASTARGQARELNDVVAEILGTKATG